jgi:hypothetical protein
MIIDRTQADTVTSTNGGPRGSHLPDDPLVQRHFRLVQGAAIIHQPEDWRRQLRPSRCPVRTGWSA